jgi:hypothetical protein
MDQLEVLQKARIVYVNNHLGKEATLAVFDSAILELEIKRDLAKGQELVEVTK